MKKLRCEGIFTHRDYDVVTDHPPYYIIYKRSSGGVYQGSEHFNGLTILVKGRRENYGRSKERVMRGFLNKVYQVHHYRGGTETYNQGESTTKERYITQLMKNANPLYVSSDSLENIYRGCYSSLSHSAEGVMLKVDKHCLSHNYLLLDWDDESKLERHLHEGKPFEYKVKTNDENSEEDPSHKDGKNIWGLVYLSRVDLLETNFEDHMRKLYHDRLRMKDKRLSVFLSFLFHRRVVRNLCVKSMIEMHIEKEVSSGERNRQKDTLKKERGFTKEVFTISFDMHARNNNCVDHLSFLLDKFHCEEVKGGTFFTNSFLNKMMYAYSRQLKEEVRYHNDTLVEGLKRGVFLLSYLFSQMGKGDRLVSSRTSYKKARRSYTTGVEDRVVYMPTLFRDHLYFPSDYVMYMESINQLVYQRTISNLTVQKQFRGEGMKRDYRTTVQVDCDEAICGSSRLRKCSAIVLDMHPNGIFLDKERLGNSNLTASFADIESYKSVSPHVVTKYLLNLSQRRPSSDGFTLDELASETLSPEREGGEGEYLREASIGDLPHVVPLPIREEDTTKGSCQQPCADFSFDVQICSRYFAPCEQGKELKRSTGKEGVHLSGGGTSHTYYGDDICADYNAMMLSNAKVFLNCEGDRKESVTTNEHRRNATLYADATHVYFHGGEDMLSVHTRDFFFFLSEVSFVQVLSSPRVNHRHGKNVQGGDAQWGANGQSEYSDKREEIAEILTTHFLSAYSFARTINMEKISNKRIIYNEILGGDPPWHHVVATNDVEMLRWSPSNGDATDSRADYYVDLVYVYSVPRGAHSYLYVLCVSVFTSVLLVFCTFVLARRFSR
ncbi:conserved Plasmodium protein, unknown function [Plasmodium knowlesi strain H]|uniref:Uncharacterized protein n=3 Tax=Plasmodium knowlesi TaxID=5850 RepID=A0A5E7WZI5_PLAKH|nr:conserved Plasmodium protein, unknown function [Plasmodium knowlesi strain H]OTN67508.1 Uncharacterized protein PKNOH_S06434100 [Plasmodium knowlesi]CAA9987611.1 conserved Plasmodium protein, unknown function [Plasmodium knowlesi strain H]SBO26990.1 conserved Plasmodium protein, unknown function [Plasmodium knowlesi strain H]SBO29248.1 conserved Plasmodium protein, unknown function [Plasmodium knowlesi strain H]VVS77085.1 conserved Plasmodium protein, unknown function [Plasmodium knowlesi s